MSHAISTRDMFWFALFHVGAIIAVALFAGCAGGPLAGKGLFAKKDSPESLADAKTRLQYQLGQARMHEQADRADKAREIYQKMIVDFPTAAEPYHRLAVAQDAEKLHSDAQQLYLQALRLDPHNAQLLNDLGYSYFLTGNLTEASGSLQRAVTLAPTNKLFRNNLGMTLGHMQQYQLALDQFIAASGEDDAYYNLAFVYSTQNQFEQAKECFRRAMQVNPRHEASRLALESFERFEKNPEMSHMEMLAATEMSGRWQAYKEDGSGVEQASFAEQRTSSSTAAANGSQALSEGAMATRQQLHARAEALLQRRQAGNGNGHEGQAMTMDGY